MRRPFTQKPGLRSRSTDLVSQAVDEFTPASVTAVTDEIESRVKGRGRKQDDRNWLLAALICGLSLVGLVSVVAWARRRLSEYEPTAAETATLMTADQFVGDEYDESTLAVTLDATPETVWANIGKLVSHRANGSIVPTSVVNRVRRPDTDRTDGVAFENLKAGDPVITGDDVSNAVVDSIVPMRSIVLGWPDGAASWSISLSPVGEDQTRLVSRRRVAVRSRQERAANVLRRPGRDLADLLALFELNDSGGTEAGQESTAKEAN